MIRSERASNSDEKISSLKNFEVIPGFQINNTFNADLELLLTLRGLSGNSGSFPFYQCLCSQSNRDLPKAEREPCIKRTIQNCNELNQKWQSETGGNKKKASTYKNCINPPLLQKSFKDESFNLPLMHITAGLGTHDIDKLEGVLFNFDVNDAILCVDPGNKQGTFWDYLRYRRLEVDLAALTRSKDLARASAAKRAFTMKITKIKGKIKELFGNDLPKLNKKSSLLMKLFNLALKKKGVHRESYWSGSFTGNNVKKFLDHSEEIFRELDRLIDENYLSSLTRQESGMRPLAH